MSRFPLAILVQRRRRRPLLSVSVSSSSRWQSGTEKHVSGTRSGNQRANERNEKEWEGWLWKEEERKRWFRGLAAQREPGSEKNWRGMMAPSPSTREARWQGVEEFRGTAKGGGARERVSLGGIHPGCSSFLQYVRVRAVRTIDEVLEKPAGATHTCRGRGVRAREGGAFARSFQRIRRRDADALPRLRHLSRHATAGIFPLSRVINERRLGQRRPTDRQPVHDDACRTPVAC